MARIRTIKPDAFTSETLCTVPRGTRWTFAGLFTYADDQGRARSDSRLIKAALYPLDDDVSLADVAHDLDLLEDAGCLHRYDVDGRHYLHFPGWSHQKINRPTESKYPPCPCEGSPNGHRTIRDASTTAHGRLTEDSVSDHGAVTNGSRAEQGTGNGTGNRDLSAADASDAPPATSTSTAVVVAFPQPAPIALMDEHTAQTLVAAWIDQCAAPPPRQVIGQIAKHTKAMLEDGIDPGRVQAGLAEWNARGLHPSTLPSIVHELANARPRGPAARRQADTDGMFDRALARAQQREADTWEAHA